MFYVGYFVKVGYDNDIVFGVDLNIYLFYVKMWCIFVNFFGKEVGGKFCCWKVGKVEGIDVVKYGEIFLIVVIRLGWLEGEIVEGV